MSMAAAESKKSISKIHFNTDFRLAGNPIKKCCLQFFGGVFLVILAVMI